MVPQLQDPPIIEVVCGFSFPPIPDLDPILVGKYWAEQKERHGFPKRQLQPPVAERPGLFLGDGVGPLRSWLVSASDEYVLQIQPDRLYFNWRRRSGEYPRFNDHGPMNGVLSASLSELASLTEFVTTTLGQGLKPTQLELAKINLLVSPKHWSNYDELKEALPVFDALPKIIEEPVVNFSLVGDRGGFQLHFALTSAALAADMAPAVQIETRVTAREPGDDMRKTFEAMNVVANQVFFDMVSPKALIRFGGKVT